MSTTSSVGPAPTTAPPSQTPNYNANASTLLFGFLVSALSIFAVFMSLAIIWNRLIARRLAIEAMLATTPVPEPPRLTRPKMREIWIMPDKQPPPWLSTNPVAVQKWNRPADSSRTLQIERNIPFWRHHLWNRLPPEITYLFYQPTPLAPSASHDTGASSQIELLHGSDIQVSLLIAMPRASRSSRQGVREEQPFHEMVFATTDASYYDFTSS